MSSIANLLSELRADMRSAKALPALTAGVVIGVVQVVFEVLFGALMFSGPLAPFLSQGIGIMVFGTFVICLIVALTGSYRGAISNHPGVVCDVIGHDRRLDSAGGEGAVRNRGRDHGRRRDCDGRVLRGDRAFSGLADLLRFVPYPVVCGVLAGTGGVISLAALSMMKATPGWQALPSLLETVVLWSWGPGVFYGLGLYLFTKRWSGPWVLPASFVFGVVFYHLSLPLLDISGEEARAAGLLLASAMEGTLWPPFHPGDLAYVNWMEVAGQIPNMLALVAVTMLCAIMYLGSFELATNRELEWDREFRAAGWASVVAGLGGGPPGHMNFPGFDRSTTGSGPKRGSPASSPRWWWAPCCSWATRS